jgi:uncharacterized RDD family membrane protein YckC
MVSHSEQGLARSQKPSSSSSAIPVSQGEILERPEDKIWRQEVISRVQQHRARRRRRCDPHATMEFDFQAGMESFAGARLDEQTSALRPSVKAETPKIIEFPRPAAQPVYFSQKLAQESEDFELAEPIMEAPRILDAPEPPPEQLDLLPAFADIQLEAEESRRALELELPLQPAAISYRLFAGVFDMMIVLMGSALFVVTFMGFANGLPQPRATLLCAFFVVGSLWLIYQYLFLVYSPGTPGMQFAQLGLCTFKGEPASVSLRRWRALASVLSAFALGLGYAWALVDEDTLGWHDRITQTHLRHNPADESAS